MLFPVHLYLDWRRWIHFLSQKDHLAHRKYLPQISPCRDDGKAPNYSIIQTINCFTLHFKLTSYLLIAWMGGGGAHDRRAHA